MYENWRLERWQTVMSDANHLFLESLHDHSAGLELDFADVEVLSNEAPAVERLE